LVRSYLSSSFSCLGRWFARSSAGAGAAPGHRSTTGASEHHHRSTYAVTTTPGGGRTAPRRHLSLGYAKLETRITRLIFHRASAQFRRPGARCIPLALASPPPAAPRCFRLPTSPHLEAGCSRRLRWPIAIHGQQGTAAEDPAGLAGCMMTRPEMASSLCRCAAKTVPRGRIRPCSRASAARTQKPRARSSRSLSRPPRRTRISHTHAAPTAPHHHHHPPSPSFRSSSLSRSLPSPLA